MGNMRPTGSKGQSLVPFLLVAAATLLFTGSARADTCTWTGGSTAWKTPGNWTGCTTAPNYPDTGDIAIINNTSNDPVIGAADTITLSGLTINASSVVTVSGTLILQGNSGGAGNLTVNSGGHLNWQSGSMSGSGTTTINSGGFLDLNTSTRFLDGRTLTNNGTATHSGPGYLYLANGGVFANAGTFDAQNDYGMYPSGSPAGTFSNSGTFKRTTSLNLYTVNTPFTNSGTVDVQSGTVDFSGVGSQTHSGPFTASGGTLKFSNGTHTFNSGANISGATVIFQGGSETINSTYNVTGTTTVGFPNPLTFSPSSTVTSVGTDLVIQGGTTNFNSGSTIAPSTIELTGGTLAGSDTINVSGVFTFTSGTILGSGPFNANGGIDMTGGGTRTVDGKTLHNGGTATMSGVGYLYLANGAVFDNKAGKTFEVQSDYGIYPSGNPAGSIANAGTFTRTTSSGLFTVNVPITNTGSVTVTSGTLTFSGSGSQTSSGTWDSTGGTLRFSTGTFTFNGAISGTNVAFDSGQETINSTYNLTGTTTFAGGNPTTFPAASTITSLGGTVVVSGGTVNLNSGSPLSIGTLTMTGGTMSGSDAITVTGHFTFNGGTLSGSGAFTAGDIEMSSGTRTVDTKTFHNTGSAVLSGFGYLYLANSAVWDNKATATFDAQNDYGIYPSGSPGGTFNNLGTFQRTSSGGTFYINAPFNNTGTVDVQTGVLNVSGSNYTQTAGTTKLDGGNLAGGFSPPISIQGGTLVGSGIIDGNVSVSSTGQLSPGNSPGEISMPNNHTLTFANPGVYNVDINGTSPGFDFDRVLISGAATLGGELKVNLGYSPALGDTFTILTHASRTGTFSKLTLPSAGAGLGWDLSYTNTQTTLTIQNLLPFFPMKVDAHSGAGTSSDVNGVLEPGETVAVEPNWQNVTESNIASTGTASNAAGPAGATYSLTDTSGDYGTITANSAKDCFTATGNCYQFQVSAPATRPGGLAHWDASFKETLTGGTNKTWMLHVGDSFADVPRSQSFYSKIETLLHTGITGGCDATHYCPTSPVNRGQMAIFIAKGIAGGGANVPTSGLAGGQPYDCSPGGTSLFTDVAPTAIYCKHVHYIAAQNVTLGCSATQFCPNTNLTRQEMAIFIAKAIVAPGGGPAVPLVYGPDPITGSSYNCNFGGNIHFTDVPAGSVACKHVHFLWAKGIIAGCSLTLYCPAGGITRDAMSKFLVNAFSLLLYGPVP